MRMSRRRGRRRASSWAVWQRREAPADVPQTLPCFGRAARDAPGGANQLQPRDACLLPEKAWTGTSIVTDLQTQL